MATNFRPLENLEYLLAQVSHRMRNALARELEDYSLTVEQWRILAFLSNGSGWTMGELAEATMISLATATRNIDSMVSETLVYRAPDPEDGRKVVIYQSEKGEKVWSKVSRCAHLSEREVLEDYGSNWVENLVSRLQAQAAQGRNTRQKIATSGSDFAE